MTLSEQVQLSGANTLYFSYGQVLVYDQSEPEPGSLWTDQHVAQGFVRRERALGIGMLTTQGNAIVRVFRGSPESLQSYNRVQSIPIVLNSGVLCIEGPEEYPIERQVHLPAGFYRIPSAAETSSSVTRWPVNIVESSQVVKNSRSTTLFLVPKVVNRPGRTVCWLASIAIRRRPIGLQPRHT